MPNMSNPPAHRKGHEGLDSQASPVRESQRIAQASRQSQDISRDVQSQIQRTYTGAARSKRMVATPFRKTVASVAAVLAAAGLASCGAPSPSPPTPGLETSQFGQELARAPGWTGPAARIVPGEFLIKFRSRASRIGIASALANAELVPLRVFHSVPGLQLVKAAPGAVDRQVLAELATEPDVEYVEPNFVVHAAAVPNDPDFARQWSLHNVGQTAGRTDLPGPDIEALSAWDITTGSDAIVVAVIDTGVDYNHPDLAANMFRNTADCNADGIDNDGDGYVDDCFGIDVVNGDFDPMDDARHGTHVAGIIGAVGNNGVGITGVAWNVRLLPCKFLDAQGTGSTAGAIACLDYIAALKDRGVNIIASNNSWGGFDYSQALDDAIAAQRDRGLLVIAAAGNDRADNDALPSYPCNYDHSNVICVASAYDGLSVFSNFGTGTVHLAAPGDAIYSTTPNNTYDTFDGTSMATPHVSGAVVLLKAQDPARDWRAIKSLVLAGAVPPIAYAIPTLTGGRLDAYRSLSCTNAVVLARERPQTFAPIDRAIGDSVKFEVTHIRCGAPNGVVNVSVSPSGEVLTLLDDGLGADEVAGDGIYSGTWTATAAGTFTFIFPAPETDVVMVNVDADLKRGFPVGALTLPDEYGLGFLTTPGILVGNIDANPDLEILLPGSPVGPLYAWKPDGHPAAGWPLWENGIISHPTLGEFDRDPTSEEVVAGVFPYGFILYSGTGARLPFAHLPSPANAPPATIDIDNDGRDEVISIPGWHVDGTPLNATIEVPAHGPPEEGVPISAAVADLDADGEPDFVVVSENHLYVSNRFGPLPGFPTSIPILYLGGTLRPVVGDVDGDGKLDIVVATFAPNSSDLNVHIFAGDGHLVRTLTTGKITSTVDVALADLDNDGIPEILIPSANYLYAWKGDGTPVPRWPAFLGAEAGGLVGAVVGDVDGDGQPDVVLLHYLTPSSPSTPLTGALSIFHRDGTPLSGFPKIYGHFAAGRIPALADIDRDGRTDLIVWPMAGIGDIEDVFAYDLRGRGPYGPIEWGQYMGGEHHRGYYESGKNLPTQAILAVQTHGEGTITSADGGIGCGGDCTEKYAKGSSVRLTASAGTGASFAGWRGACAGQSNPCTLTVSRFTATSADFNSPLTVTLAGSGTGTVRSDLPGIVCPSDCSEDFAARTKVTLTATADANQQFDGWSGACAGSTPTCTVLMTSAQTVTARFVNHRRLTIVTSGSGTGVVTTPDGLINCGTACAADYPPNTSVTLTVTPTPDSYVQNWTSPCLSYVSTCTIVLDTDRSLTVTYALKPLVSVAVSGDGHGRITSAPAGIDCGTVCAAPATPDTFFELRALPDLGSYIGAWVGDCSAFGAPTCVIRIDGPKSVTVEFRTKPLLTVSLAGTGSGTVSSSDGGIQCGADCSEGYAPGFNITLTATPTAGSTFSGWSGGCTGTATTCTVLTGAAQSVTATFTRDATSGGGGSGSGNGGGGGGGGGESLIDLALMLLGLALLRLHYARARSRPGRSDRSLGGREKATSSIIQNFGHATGTQLARTRC